MYCTKLTVAELVPPSIIHCDRMRRAKEQLLTGENTGREIPADESEVPSDNEVRQTISEDELVVLDPEVRQTTSEDELDHEELQHEVRPSKRQIRKPIWTKDYYLSTCRLKMPLTKTTPRKRCTCPVCKETIPMEQFIRHVTNCPEARQKCTEAGCSSTFKKTSYMLKHRKRMHDGTNKATANTSVTQNTEDSESSSESGSESDPWDNDPEINLGEGQCTEKSAPMIRKPNTPSTGAQRKEASGRHSAERVRWY